jgi:hypothetical protein
MPETGSGLLPGDVKRLHKTPRKLPIFSRSLAEFDLALARPHTLRLLRKPDCQGHPEIQNVASHR